MTLVVGADEAGYGPNLGPLVVAATAWRVAAPPGEADAVLDAALEAAGRCLAGHPVWGDSKRIHRGGAGFAHLEHGALVALSLPHAAVADVGAPGTVVAESIVPDAWTALLARVGASGQTIDVPEAAVRRTLRLPLASGADLMSEAATVRATLGARGVECVSIACSMVEPASFNAQLAAGLNKSDVLSQATLDLVVRTLPGDEPAMVCCDRHGGRKRYAPLLVRHFGTPLVRIEEETAHRSAYVLPEAEARVEFRVRAEARPPVGVASVVAKYLREVAMHAFNRHWQSAVPGLRATAGYPVDAARWRAEVEPAVRHAGVPWDAVWRRA